MLDTKEQEASIQTDVGSFQMKQNQDASPLGDEPNQSWEKELRTIYEEAVGHYQQGGRRPDRVIPSTGLAFLASSGTTSQELYDFVEDWSEVGEPPFETVAGITAVRRDYFFRIQGGEPSSQKISMESLPPGSSALGGYRWLPRIIAKARDKLRGEMPPDLMYGCGADRPFLRKVGIAPADFLRIVWEAGNDDQAILKAVQTRATQS